MSASDLFLAMVMLAAPIGTPEYVSDERYPAVRDAIHAKAIQLEIMDIREANYFLRKDDFQQDLDLLRQRYQDFKDAPPLSATVRLPDRETIHKYIKFNRDYKQHLETRLLWEPDRADVIQPEIDELDRLYRLWDNARDAQCEFYYITVRRAALAKFGLDRPHELPATPSK